MILIISFVISVYISLKILQLNTIWILLVSIKIFILDKPRIMCYNVVRAQNAPDT